MASFQIPETYDFGTAQRGIAMQNQGTNELVNQMSNLGSQIAESISLNNARKEATRLAPIIQAQYQKGFEEIAKGNIGGGLGSIYGTSSRVMQNPILSRMAQDANQAAGYIANSQIKTLMEDKQLQNRKAFYDYTLEHPKPTASSQDPIKRFEISLKNQQLVDDLTSRMGSSVDPIEFDNARQQLMSLSSEAAKAGINIDLPDIVKYSSQEERDRVKKLSKEIADKQAKIDRGEETEGMLWWKKDNLKELKDLREKLSEIYSVSGKIENRMKSEFEKTPQTQPNPYSGLDEPPLPEEEIDFTDTVDIPLVPEVGNQLSGVEREALDWANSNPSDPRSGKIKAKLGVQ